jgi:uncharacterized protein HemX
MSENFGGIEASAGNKKIKVWGNELIQVLQLIVLCIVAFGYYKHDVDAAEQQKTVVQAVREQTVVQKEQLNAQREQNCLQRLTQEQRKQSKEIEFCQNLGKGR